MTIEFADAIHAARHAAGGADDLSIYYYKIPTPTPFASGHVYPFGGGNLDGIFYVNEFTDNSGSGTGGAGTTQTYLFGGTAAKKGAGSLSGHWAYITHFGSGEAGLFIGTVQSDPSGAGGNLWGADLQIIDRYPTGGSQIFGQRIQIVPTVLNTTASTYGQLIQNAGDNLGASGTFTSGSASFTVTSGTIPSVGMRLYAATCVPQFATVTGVAGSVVTMSAVASASGTGVGFLGQWALKNGTIIAGAFNEALTIYADSGLFNKSLSIDSYGNLGTKGAVYPVADLGGSVGTPVNRWGVIYANQFQVVANIIPQTDGVGTVGTSGSRWAGVYTNGLTLYGASNSIIPAVAGQGNLGTTSNRFTQAAVNNLFVNTASLGGGGGCIGMANAAVVPTVTPTGGGVIYIQGGALKYMGGSGTITTVAPA